MSLLRSTPPLTRRQLLAASVVAMGSAATGQDLGVTGNDTEQPTANLKSRLKYESPQTQNWRIGLILKTPVTCANVVATFTVPRDWPEQKVTLTGKTIDPPGLLWATRELSDGVKQVVVKMNRVPAGSTVEATFNYQIERSRILAPELTDDLVLPNRRNRKLRMFIGNSPYIDASHARIKKASREVAETDAGNAWERVEQIYDHVREKVAYVEGEIKKASDALKDGQGDCEEMTSLFIAMCRNAGVPARMVWIPDHCYPEFYLEDGDGNGHWFPCQAAGTRQFGRMDEYRPVLQKGDRFFVPEKKTTVRYVSEFFHCDKKGKSDPRPIFIREMIDT